MNISNKKSFLLFLILFSNNLHSQTFSSRKASFYEKLQIMYSKGHFNFMYTPNNNIKLTLNKENLFTYSAKYCNSNVIYKGTWKSDNDTLILKINNNKEQELKFIKYSNSVYYQIDNTKRIADNKEMKNLTLLSTK